MKGGTDEEVSPQLPSANVDTAVVNRSSNTGRSSARGARVVENAGRPRSSSSSSNETKDKNNNSNNKENEQLQRLGETAQDSVTSATEEEEGGDNSGGSSSLSAPAVAQRPMSATATDAATDLENDINHDGENVAVVGIASVARAGAAFASASTNSKSHDPQTTLHHHHQPSEVPRLAEQDVNTETTRSEHVEESQQQQQRQEEGELSINDIEQQQQQQDEQFDEEPLLQAAHNQGINQLVEATLIRDVDEGSNSTFMSDPDHPIDASNNNNINPSFILPLDHAPPTTILTRSSTGALTVQSESATAVAVVEAKPVEPATSQTMSRKLICAVMAGLLLVIAALSVGFAVSAKRQDQRKENDEANSSSDGDSTTTVLDAALASGTTFAPSISQAGQSISPTVAPIPVLQRLAAAAAAGDNDNIEGVLRCGVLPGPGLFYLGGDSGQEPMGLDASLCAAVAAAATGDPTKIEYKVLTFSTVLASLADGEVDIVSAGITHTMERQVYHAATGVGFAFTIPYLYQGMQLAGDPEFVGCGDQGLEFIASCGDIRVCVVSQSTHQQKLSSFLPGRRLIAVGSREELRQGLRNKTCNVIAHEGYNLAESLVREAGYEGEYLVGSTLFSKEPLAMLTAHDPQFADFANSVLQSLIVAEANNITQSTADQFNATSVFGEPYSDMFRHAIALGGNYGELYERYMEPYSKRQSLNLVNYAGDGNTSGWGLLYSHPFGSISNSQVGPGDTLKAIMNRGFLRCGIHTNRPGFAVVESDGTASGIEVDYCHAYAASIFMGDISLVQLVEIEDILDGFALLASDDLDIVTGVPGNLRNNVNVSEVGQGFALTQPYFYGDDGTGVTEDENLSLATTQSDHRWSTFVYWLAMSIVAAEEESITQGQSNDMPDIFLFGRDFTLMFQDAILAVGNYGEMYARNLRFRVPRSGRNLLNGNVGPQLYPLPGLIN